MIIYITGPYPPEPIAPLLLPPPLKAYFAELKPLASCEKRIRNMEDLCQQLPDNDPTHRTLDSATGALADVTDEIEKTRLKLLQHPDKWREWNDR